MVRIHATKVEPTLIPKQSIECQGYKNVMRKCQNGACAEADILKSEPDVDQHTYPSNKHSDDCLSLDPQH